MAARRLTHLLRQICRTLARFDAGAPSDQIQDDAGWADARIVSYHPFRPQSGWTATTHSVAALAFGAA